MTKLETLLACLPDAPFRAQLTAEISSLRAELEDLRIQLKQERQDHGHNIRQLKITASEMLKGKDEQLENMMSVVASVERERDALQSAINKIAHTGYVTPNGVF